MTEEKKKAKRDYAIHINQVELLGRVVREPITKDPKFVRVPIVVPTWGRDEPVWVPFSIDVVAAHRDKCSKATIGDFFRCTCFIAEREIRDDNDDKKYVKVLQIDPYREVGLMPADAPENPFKPPYYGICYSRVLVAGRNFIRKKQMDGGDGDTPILREGTKGVYCYANIIYQDPFQPQPPDGEYFKDLFLDVAINGDAAKIVSEHCHNRAQIIVRGELVKKECDFQIGGRTPKEPQIRLVPGGFNFVSLGAFGGKKEPKPAQEYDAKDTRGIDGLDDDIDF